MKNKNRGKKAESLGTVFAHNNKNGEIHKGDPRNCKECKYYFKSHEAPKG